MSKLKDGSGAMKRRLGRGLESLLSVGTPVSIDTSLEDVPRETSAGEDGERIEQIPVGWIHPNPDQPRRTFDEGALEQLAQSMRSAGVMQPIIVRRRDETKYEIVAGERRWRAAGMLGLERIPAIVRELEDQTVAEWALIENLQREDLNPIERADAFRRLSELYHLTHQEIADLVGLDRSSVSNHLRLCDLDRDAREALIAKQIDMGHGRALLAVHDPSLRKRLLHAAIAEGLSVRELERRVRAATAQTPKSDGAKPQDPLTMHMRDLERGLGTHLGTKVAIQPGARKGTGSLTIEFYTLDQFEGLLDRLGYRPEA